MLTILAMADLTIIISIVKIHQHLLSVAKLYLTIPII